jgi:hypothetical protein
MGEEAIRGLLMHQDWSLRSFEEIKRHLRGFDAGEGNELRKLLVTAGALAFDTKDGREHPR